MSALPASSVRVVPGAASSSVIDQALAELLPVADGLWHDVYHVVALIGESEGAQLWRAFRTDTAEEVVLRVLPGAKGDARSEAWTRLGAIDHPHLQKTGEIHYVEKYCVEIYHAPRGVTLDVWRKGRTSVDVASVESIVRQLSEAVGILHASGLAHLGLRPAVVFIEETKTGLLCTLSGLGTVVRFEGEKLIPAQANPLYAPPEAVTLALHEPGPAICGWDWWTLGRVTQELILGHHVLDEMPDADPAESEPARLARAETLLFEQDPEGLKAGAVEAMNVDPRLTVLLRGLLASSPEGRWGGEFVDRWVRQQLVKENYSEKRIEHKFRWRGRLYTVPEAAKEMQTAESWGEAASQVFKAGSPGMLAHFIANMPEQHLVHKQLGELLKFAASDPLKTLPTEASREVALMLALLQLSGEKFIWRGRRINGEILRTLLNEEHEGPARFALARSLTDRTVTAQIERYDLEAGRSLAAVALVVADAGTLIRRAGWLKEINAAEDAAIFRLALEPDAGLKAAVDRIKQGYAGASDAGVDKILKSEKPTRSELVMLAWAEPRIATLRFNTHAEMKSRRLAELTGRCEQLARLVFWQKLDRTLKAGPLLFGPAGIIVPVWLTLGLFLLVHKPGPLGLLAGLVPLVFVAILRMTSRSVIEQSIKPWTAETTPLGWNNHFARCRDEISALAEQHKLPVAPAEASASFARVNAERADVAKPEGCPAVAEPARPFNIWSMSIASWVLVVAIVAGSVGLMVKAPPSWSAHQKEWKTLFASAPKEKTKPKEPPVTQITWPYKAPSETPFEVVTQGPFNPDSEQAKFATERARALLRNYKPETIDSYVAVYIALEGGKGGLLFYDGKKGAFMGRNGVLINFVPMPKMWMQIGDQRALFIEK